MADFIKRAAGIVKPKDVEPEREACRITIVKQSWNAPISVAAPMKHKPICYEILKEAQKVIARSEERCFLPVLMQRSELVIVMRMNGRVDVAAPMPNRELSMALCMQARIVIERYGEEDLNPIGSIDSKDKLDA